MRTMRVVRSLMLVPSGGGLQIGQAGEQDEDQERRDDDAQRVQEEVGPPRLAPSHASSLAAPGHTLSG